MQVQHCFNILNGLCNRKFNELVYKSSVKNEACKSENVVTIMRSHTSGAASHLPHFSFGLQNL